MKLRDVPTKDDYSSARVMVRVQTTDGGWVRNFCPGKILGPTLTYSIFF